MNMNKYDPANELRVLRGDCGVEFDLSADMNEAKIAGGRGSSSRAFLGTAIRCLLSGLDHQAFQLLQKALQWVIAALADNEIPKRFLNDRWHLPDGESALRYQTLALIKWLLNNEHDAESYQRFVECEDRFLESSKVGKDRVSVSLLLPIYMDAGACPRVLQLIASPGMTVGKSSGSVRNEGQMAYLLCRHRLGQDSAEVEVSSVVRRFLDSQVDGWLTRGQFVRAAEWMKIIYWQGGTTGLSAKEALLKSYDHLPGRSRPA